MSKNVDDDGRVVTDMLGVPPLAFLPPKNFHCKMYEERHKFVIPREGTFYELDKDFFDEDAGSFCIVTKDNVIDIPTITKVLFAMKKYPALEDNQLFCPSHIKINDDTVELIGQMLTVISQAK